MAVSLGQAVGYLTLDARGFNSTLAEARRGLSEFANQSSSISGRFSALGSTLTSVGGAITKSISAPLLGVGAAAFKLGADFDAAMSQVAATMGVPVSEIDNLREKAIQMGNDTKFSAKDAAEGLNFLALAGYSADQQMAALPQTLNLAAAGGLELGAASDMLTDGLSALGLASKDSGVLMGNMETMVDQMAKTASKSNTSVGQLGNAMLTIGGTAKGLAGFSVDAAHGTAELSTALGILADNSIKGSEGGNMLRRILVRLNPTGNAAKQAMKELGVSAYDADGNMRPLKDTFSDLNKALSGYTQEEKEAAIATIFGQQSLSGVNALLGTSSERWDELEKEILDSKGAAQDMADTMSDNLPGDIDKLNSALGTASITIKDNFTSVLRGTVQAITGVVNAFNQAPAAVQGAIIGFGAFLAVLGPILLIAGQIASAIGALGPAFSAVATVMANGFPSMIPVLSGIATGLLQVGAVIGVIIAAVDAFRAAWDNNIMGIRENTATIFDGIKDLFSGVFDFISGILSTIVTLWTEDWGGIRTMVATVIAGIVAIITPLFGTVSGIVNGIRDAWNSDFLGIQTTVTNVIATIGSVISSLTTIVTGVVNIIVGVFNGIVEVGSQIGASIKAAWDSDFAGIRTLVTSVMGTIQELFSRLQIAAETMASAVSAVMSGDFSTAWELAKQAASIAWNAIKDAFSNLVQAAQDAAPKIKQAIIDKFNEIKDKAPEIIRNMVDKVGNVLTGLVEKAKVVLPNYANAIKVRLTQLAQEAPEIIQKLVTKAGKFLGELVDKAKEHLPKFASKVAQGAKDAVSKFGEFIQKMAPKAAKLLGEVVTKAAEFAGKFAKKALEAGKQFLDNLSKNIVKAAPKVGEVLGKVLAKVVKFVTDIGKKALEAGKKFVSSLLKGSDGAPKSMGEIGQEILEKLKELPGQIFDIGVQIIQGLIDGIKSMFSTAIEAVSGFVSGLIKGFKDEAEIHSPSKRAKREVGEEIGQGVIDGVKAKKGAAKKSAEELANEIFSAAKSKIGSYNEIYNLSAQQQANYWKKIVDSTKSGSDANLKAQAEYAKAVKKSTDEQLKAETDYVKRKELIWKAQEAATGKNAKKEAEYWKEVLEHTKKGSDNYLKVLEKYNKAVSDQQKEQEKKEKDYVTKRKKIWDAWESEHGDNAQKEAKFWEKTLNHLTKGSNQYLDVLKKYNTAVNKVSEEQWKKDQEDFERKSQYEEMTLAQQMHFWAIRSQKYAEGTQQRMDVDKKYSDAKKSYTEQLTKIEEDYAKNTEEINKKLKEDIEAIEKAYTDAIENRKNSILSEFKLFDKYEKQEEVSGDSLIQNLGTQVSALKTWQSQIAMLENKQILPVALVDEIKEMGVGATAQIQALNQMTSSDLTTYGNLWQEKIDIATERATKELEGMKQETEAKQKELTQTAQDELKKLEETYKKELKQLGADGKTQAKLSTQAIMKALTNGVKQEHENVKNQLDRVKDAFDGTYDHLKQIKSRIDSIVEEMIRQAERAKEAKREADKLKSASLDDSFVPKNKRSGSHKSGLDFVPYDGYMAELHRGERVLTESEAEAYNAGGRAVSMVNNFYGTKPLDERETARQFKLAQRQIALNW